jgi:predicted nuclease of predicted toxin-antitoxin system
VAARFAVLADNHVRPSLVEALSRSGWDVVRSVDLFGEENDDEELLAWAAANNRVFATCDKPTHRIAHRWLAEGRPFRMVYWWLGRYREMTDGDMVEAFPAIAAKPNAFAYSIEYIKPGR